MFLGKGLLIAGAFALYGLPLGASPAAAQAAGPSNALDHTFQSLEEFRDEVRARAGWHKSGWVCQPNGPCAWQQGYWGPPSAPPSPPGIYVYARPVGSAGWSGYFPN